MGAVARRTSPKGPSQQVRGFLRRGCDRSRCERKRDRQAFRKLDPERLCRRREGASSLSCFIVGILNGCFANVIRKPSKSCRFRGVALLRGSESRQVLATEGLIGPGVGEAGDAWERGNAVIGSARWCLSRSTVSHLLRAYRPTQDLPKTHRQAESKGDSL